LPDGNRNASGDFNGAGNYGDWWTATDGGSGFAYMRGMVYDFDYIVPWKIRLYY
jgi:hypothetical protein